MTPARTHANGLRIPSQSQLWLAAMLCVFVELVHHVAALFGMPVRRRSDDWHIGEMPDVLPQPAGDIQFKEPHPARKVVFVVMNRRLEAGLMVSLSNHEAVLTALACALRASSFDRLRMRRSIRQQSLPAPA